MLSVFLLPVFTCLGHEHQDLSSLCHGMHVCTDKNSVYTLIRKSFWGFESEPMLTPREKSSLPEKFSPEEDQTHDAASSRTASPTHNQLSYSGPSKIIQNKTAQGKHLNAFSSSRLNISGGHCFKVKVKQLTWLISWGCS